MVMERMKHLEKYKWSRGKKWQGEEVERNQMKEEEFVFVCDDCGKVCKSKAGLTIHEKRMHGASKVKKEFACECGRKFGQEANLKNHRKKCVGSEEAARVHERKRGNCPACGKEMNKTNIARHQREACPRR